METTLTMEANMLKQVEQRSAQFNKHFETMKQLSQWKHHSKTSFLESIRQRTLQNNVLDCSTNCSETMQRTLTMETPC